jgi:hypothetical protein
LGQVEIWTVTEIGQRRVESLARLGEEIQARAFAPRLGLLRSTPPQAGEIVPSFVDDFHVVDTRLDILEIISASRVDLGGHQQHQGAGEDSSNHRFPPTP